MIVVHFTADQGLVMCCTSCTLCGNNDHSLTDLAIAYCPGNQGAVFIGAADEPWTIQR